MNTLLIAITIAAVAGAVAAFAALQRAKRHERERSDARAAALAAAAEIHGDAEGGWQQVGGEWQWNPSASREAAIVAHAAQPAAERLFGTVDRDPSSAGRLPVMAAAALIVALGGALVFLNNSATPEPAATVASAGSHPLELVALGHAREMTLLTITGTIRNPAAGARLEGLTAVVSLLDRNGALISTKDVPLDYRALGPGEEAPFKVSVPDPGSIARYRVSFRAGTDVVPHVDRRTDTKLASALQ